MNQAVGTADPALKVAVGDHCPTFDQGGNEAVDHRLEKDLLGGWGYQQPQVCESSHLVMGVRQHRPSYLGCNDP